MRIAVFGGSFDPPHCGHTGIALEAARRLRLDRVLLAPTGRQPLKRGQAAAPYADRLSMVELACRARPPLEASALDAPRPDGGFNYTCDLLQRLATLYPAEERFFMAGADSLSTLRSWHRAAEALMLAEWIVAARPGFPLGTEAGQRLAEALPAGVVAGEPAPAGESADAPLLRVPLSSGRARQTLWLMPGLEYRISATALRAALADPARELAPAILDPAVAEYARRHNLYRAPDSTARKIR